MTQSSFMDEDDVPRRRRGRPQQIGGWAAQVFQHLPTTSSNRWMKARELAKATGLTNDQVYRAIGYLKDSFPEFPIVSSVTHGYRFSTSTDEVNVFRKYKAKVVIKMIDRFWSGTLEPFFQSEGYTAREMRRARMSLDHIIDQINAELVEA